MTDVTVSHTTFVCLHEIFESNWDLLDKRNGISQFIVNVKFTKILNA